MKVKRIASLILGLLLIVSSTAFAVQLDEIVLPEYTVVEYAVPF